MTVDELRRKLEGVPGDWLVVQAKDGEGNWFYATCDLFGRGQFNGPEGKFVDAPLPGDDPEYLPDWYNRGEGVPCLVLWPDD